MNMPKSWEFLEPSFSEVYPHVMKAYESSKSVFPPKEKLFQAFEYTSFDDVSVVLLGQDPYHTRGMANGLAFSVDHTVSKLPPSLRNIMKELEDDVGVKKVNGDLSGWAKQGVLLLNTVLTVEEGNPGSHGTIGWQKVTDEVISACSHKGGVTFVFLGKFASKKRALIDETKNTILEAPHPSPFSAHRGFFGSRIFSKLNDSLEAYGKTPIRFQE